VALCRFINEKITVSDNNLHITELLFPIREFSQMRLPLKINQRQDHLWPPSLLLIKPALIEIIKGPSIRCSN